MLRPTDSVLSNLSTLLDDKARKVNKVYGKACRSHNVLHNLHNFVFNGNLRKVWRTTLLSFHPDKVKVYDDKAKARFHLITNVKDYWDTEIKPAIESNNLDFLYQTFAMLRDTLPPPPGKNASSPPPTPPPAPPTKKASSPPATPPPKKASTPPPKKASTPPPKKASTPPPTKKRSAPPTTASAPAKKKNKTGRSVDERTNFYHYYDKWALDTAMNPAHDLTVDDCYYILNFFLGYAGWQWSPGLMNTIPMKQFWKCAKCAETRINNLVKQRQVLIGERTDGRYVPLIVMHLQ